MGLQGQVFPAPGQEGVQDLPDVAVAPARGHHAAVAEQGVLDVHVVDPVLQHLPGFQGILAALDKVGGIENPVQLRHLRQHVQAPGSDVAVDALFVFMAQGNAGSGADLHHPVQPVQHLGAEGSGILSRGDEKGKHADILRAEDFGNVQGVAQGVEMGFEVILFDIDLAQGRTDGPGHQAGVLQPGADLPGLVQGDGGDVFTVHIAHFQPLHAVPAQGFDLEIDPGAGFIREGVNPGMGHGIIPPFPFRSGGADHSVYDS